MNYSIRWEKLTDALLDDLLVEFEAYGGIADYTTFISDSPYGVESKTWCVIAFDNQKPVGVVGYQMLPGRRMQSEGSLVRRGYRGKGIGMLLWHHVIQHERPEYIQFWCVTEDGERLVNKLAQTYTETVMDDENQEYPEYMDPKDFGVIGRRVDTRGRLVMILESSTRISELIGLAQANNDDIVVEKRGYCNLRIFSNPEPQENHE